MTDKVYSKADVDNGFASGAVYALIEAAELIKEEAPDDPVLVLGEYLVNAVVQLMTAGYAIDQDLLIKVREDFINPRLKDSEND